MELAIAYITGETKTINTSYKRKDIKILEIKSPKTLEQLNVLNAITTAGAADIFNMERVEVLGDSFLKFAVSLYLLHKFPNWNEGYLTTMKGKMVSNKNLLYLASTLNTDIPGMIISTAFAPKINWVPPLFSLPKNVLTIVKDNDLDPQFLEGVTLSAREIQNGYAEDPEMHLIRTAAHSLEPCSANQYYFINKQYVSDKVVADTLEAILGTTLQSYGITQNFKVLQFFGIINRNEVNPAACLQEKLVHVRIRANISNNEVDKYLPDYVALEKKLNYKFQDRAYLLSALTHPSYQSNRITGCYQQLEFFGDAVLDFLITCYIFEQNPNIDQGKLTDLRIALVNNDTLGSVCIKNHFHKHILYDNEKLTKAINDFENHQKTQHQSPYVTSSNQVEVPKALGDVVESLIGAVLLDTNYDLEKTWTVIYGLLEEEIIKFTVNTPIQVVRELYEYKDADPIFSKHVIEDGKFVRSVTFTCRGRKITLSGFGENSKHAKQAAAKSALKFLKQY